MKTDSISKLFEGGGLIIHKLKNHSLFDFQYDEIVSLFEKFGIILFRGFELEGEEIINFTDIFTEKYARDAYRRKTRFKEKNIHDSYKEKMEDLKISRKNEMKSLKNDFASRRDLLFKKYPPKKRKKKQLDINDTKPNKVKSDKKKIPIIRKK